MEEKLKRNPKSDSRISRERYLVEVVTLVAKRSTCVRAKVGAIIIKDGRVIVTGYNGTPSGMAHCEDLEGGCVVGPGGGCQFTVHAEANCIAFAARNGISVKDTTLLCTHLPCLECSKLIINSGIKRVIYLEEYRIQDGKYLLQGVNIPCEKLGEYSFCD